MIFSSKEDGILLKKLKWWISYFKAAGAGAGAGEKNTQSRSKTDRLRNTGPVGKKVEIIPATVHKVNTKLEEHFLP